jgi:hypothetical protein
MAWQNPQSVATGDVLTASKWNQDVVENTTSLPRGVIGDSGIISSQQTIASLSPTDLTGYSCNATYGPNRILRVSLQASLFTSGGIQAVSYRVLRGSTTLRDFVITAEANAAGINLSQSHFVIFTGPATGATETFKAQLWALSTATNIVNFANATSNPGRLIVEDLGAS